MILGRTGFVPGALPLAITAAVLTQPAAPPAAATPRGAETLSLVVGGIPTPLGADQEIPVAGDLVARATVGRENENPT